MSGRIWRGRIIAPATVIEVDEDLREPDPIVAHAGRYAGHKVTGALFSDDGIYRYALWRSVARIRPPQRDFILVGLNPSTADEFKDDPTIRRCKGFAKREGCDRLVMLNLFALRSTNPRGLEGSQEPIGAFNDDVLAHFLGTATTAPAKPDSILVAAWGTHGALGYRDQQVLARHPLASWQCFGITRHGFPSHPLYMRADAPLIPYPFRP